MYKMPTQCEKGRQTSACAGAHARVATLWASTAISLTDPNNWHKERVKFLIDTTARIYTQGRPEKVTHYHDSLPNTTVSRFIIVQATRIMTSLPG